MTYLNLKRKPKPQPRNVRCRSGIEIDARDDKLVVKVPALTAREKKLNWRKP